MGNNVIHIIKRAQMECHGRWPHPRKGMTVAEYNEWVLDWNKRYNE